MDCRHSPALRDFPGRDRLIAEIDAAVARSDTRDTARALCASLEAMIASGELKLPDCVLQPVDGHYARRELYRSPGHGYGVIAMTWGPGQGTPIHDHAGMWCVEAVYHGCIEIDQYDLRERDGEVCRFVHAGTIRAGCASAGSLIPPYEYHTIRNPSDAAVAVSLHIYQGAMTRCGVFAEAGDGWYRYIEKQLALDEAA